MECDEPQMILVKITENIKELADSKYRANILYINFPKITECTRRLSKGRNNKLSVTNSLLPLIYIEIIKLEGCSFERPYLWNYQSDLKIIFAIDSPIPEKGFRLYNSTLRHLGAEQK